MGSSEASINTPTASTSLQQSWPSSLPQNINVENQSTKAKFVKGKKVRSMFEDVVEELSEMARMIEKWGSQPGQMEAARLEDRRKKLRENIKKTNKRLQKLSDAIPNCPGYQQTDLPVSLIEHVDAGKNPYVWLKELHKQAQTENETARGELLALASLKNTISALLQKPEEKPILACPVPPEGLPNEDLSLFAMKKEYEAE